MQIETVKPEDIQEAPKQEAPQMRKVREVQSGPAKQVVPSIMKQGNMATPSGNTTNPFYREPGAEIVDPSEYPITYECLCGAKIPDIPAKLHYKILNGFHVTKINEFTGDTIDLGLNDILDSLCYESKSQHFSHWNMTTNEKIRSFLNVRLNSVGKSIENLVGVCSECAEQQVFLNVLISKFEETGLNEKYLEPFPLRYVDKNVEHKFKARLLRSGDIKKAKQLYTQDPFFVSKMFPDAKKDDETIVVLVLEYANTILEHDGGLITYEQAITFCRDSAEVMKAITSFNDYFNYGMNLSTEQKCNNKECPSNTRVDVKTNAPVGRSLFRIPTQPTLFVISASEEEAAKSYFDNE